MPTFPARILILAWCFSSLTLSAARGQLQADGILRVRGSHAFSPTITVMPSDAPAYSLPEGLEHFVLALELDNTFIVTFEQVGCVTKQLYFDTTVPADQHAGSFTFPFRVILEVHDGPNAFTYAGPVGFIRYHHESLDFAYETDYAILVDPAFAVRLAGILRTGTDPLMAPAAFMNARVVTTAYRRPEEEAPESVETFSMGTVAPMVGQVPRLVHRTGGILDPAASEAQVQAPSVLPVPIAVLLLPIAEAKIMASSVSPVAIVVVRVAQPVTVRMDREEELVVDVNRVTLIVRLCFPDGRTTEYRRVAHRYGAVFFFRDGLSVTEGMYATAMSL